MYNEDNRVFPPWSRTESLNEMTAEAGIDFDEFIACLKDDITTREMAERFAVSEKTIHLLKEHFIHYGISSVMGGD